MSIEYAFEKFWLAVHGMAISPTSIQERVGDAYAYHLMHINADEDLPEEIQERFHKLEQAITREPAKGEEGTIAATVAVMSEDEAVELAREISEMMSHVHMLQR